MGCLILNEGGKYSPLIEEGSIFIKIIVYQFTVKSKENY
jgi:hypothetical protein